MTRKNGDAGKALKNINASFMNEGKKAPPRFAASTLLPEAACHRRSVLDALGQG
jgi:hypothetical protein